MQRLSADWQRVHGHPLLLAETFVDTVRFHGGCYRVATVLTIAIAAVLAGHRSYAAMAEWAQQRLTQSQLKRLRARYEPSTGRFVAPSEPTLRRMLTHADAPALEATLIPPGSR